MSSVSPPPQFRRVLVTGASGFVGRLLVPALRTRLEADAELLLAGHATGGAYYALDLTSEASVRSVVEQARPDLVIHLAGQASAGQAAGAAKATWTVNVDGCINLAAAVGEVSPEATLLFASSAEVYGLSFNDAIVTEDVVPRPASTYARSKLAAEMALDDILPATSRLIVVRPSNHSGPGQDGRFVIPAFASQIAGVERGSNASIKVGDLSPRRDFMHVQDVLDAYLTLLSAAPSLPMRSTFNVSSGQVFAVGELLDRLLAMSPAFVSVEIDPARVRPNAVPTAAIDSSRLRDITGWAPRIGIDEMLAAVLADRRSEAAATAS